MNNLAIFEPAFDFCIVNEDSSLSGKITVDAGGKTRFGIAERYNPQASAMGLFDLPPAEALDVAKKIYEQRYWVWGDILNQSVANYLFDCSVNPGPFEAVRIAQAACCNSGFSIPIDGRLGSMTEAAINRAPSVVLLPELAHVRSDYYVDRDKEERAKGNTYYPLKGLLRRAARIA